MSHRIGNIVVLCEEEDRKCQLCGAIAECRPYGPNGEDICYDCGMKDQETTDRMIGKVLFGDRDVH